MRYRFSLRKPSVVVTKEKEKLVIFVVITPGNCFPSDILNR